LDTENIFLRHSLEEIKALIVEKQGMDRQYQDDITETYSEISDIVAECLRRR
jgi:hypothetical protein